MDRKELNKREKEVMLEVLDGHSYNDIADKLKVSRRTVEAHMHHVYAKLNVATRIELMRRAIEMNMLLYNTKRDKWTWTQPI